MAKKRRKLGKKSLEFFKNNNFDIEDVLRRSNHFANGYRAYVRDYKRMAKKLAKEGGKPADPMMSKLEYYTNYEFKYQDRLEDVAAKKRKTVGDINREMIKEQTYKLTKKQAEGYLKMLEQRGYITEKNGKKYYVGSAGEDIQGPSKKEATIRNARITAIPYLEEEIKSRYNQLRGNGVDGYAASKIIGQEFFGSI